MEAGISYVFDPLTKAVIAVSYPVQLVVAIVTALGLHHLHRFFAYFSDPSEQSGVAIRLMLGMISWFSGFASVLPAFLMAGSDHGWLSPIWVSWVSIITGPLTGIIWFYIYKIWINICAVFLLMGLTTCDLLIWWLTIQEGIGSFQKVWERAPIIVLLWLVFWFYPQILLLVAIVVLFAKRMQAVKRK